MGPTLYITEHADRVVIAEDSDIGSRFTLTRAKWMMIYASAGSLLAAIAILIATPETINDPLAFAMAQIFCLLFLTLALFLRYVGLIIVGGGDTYFAEFNFSSGELDIAFRGFFGPTRERVQISSISKMRLGRGEWDGETAKSQLIVELENGETIVMPGSFCAEDLMLLKVLTGIRRT